MAENSNNATVISASYRNHLAFGMFVRKTSDSDFDMDSKTHLRYLWVDDFLSLYPKVLKKTHDADGLISRKNASDPEIRMKTRGSNVTT